MKKSLANNNHWYLFMLFPFVAGIFAMKNYKASWAKNIIWAFVVFFGLSFGFAKEIFQGTETSDVFRYTDQVKELYKRDLNFSDIVKLYEENQDIDILRITIAIIVSRFTNNEHILLAVFGFIFGYFFTRNIWFVLDRIIGKIKPMTFILLAAYFLVNPFWNINTFRFCTATHVFIYGLLPYLFEGKKKGILVAALSVLIHFSFILPLLILFFYVLLGNRIVIYFIFFLSSLVVSQINIQQFNLVIEANVPENLLERTSTYRDEDSVEDFREGKKGDVVVSSSWHVAIFSKALHWSLMALIILIFYRRKIIERVKKRYLDSLSFNLLFWGVANFMSTLPSGGRYLIIASLSALPLIIFFVQNLYGENYTSKKILIFSPALLFFIIVAIRIGFYYLSVTSIIGNPFFLLITDKNIPLNDLIK